MAIKFGPAGNAESFFEQGNKSSLQAPEWIAKMGLDAYEYQCGRGVKISDDSAQKLGEEAARCGISLSIHAPYYINIATPEAEKQDNSVRYVLQSAHAAKMMGAERIVVHMGAAGKQTRAVGIDLSKRLVHRMLKEMREDGYGGVTICLETMGKVNQLGTVAETVDVCSIDDSLLPTVDFGHVNAREQGILTTKEAYEDLFSVIENKLGFDRLKRMHVHFSKIEFTHMGEKKHLKFEEDPGLGPEYEPLAELIAKRGLEPVIICESAGTQAEDALKMKEIYVRMKQNTEAVD